MMTFKRKLALALAALAFFTGTLAAAKPKDAWQSDRMVSNGYRYLARDGAKKALKLFQKATKYDSGNQQAWVALAAAYQALGKDDDAADALATAGVKALPSTDLSVLSRVARYSGQGYMYLAKGNYSGAAHYFKAALKEDPTYAHAKAGLAAVKAGGKGGDDDFKDDGKDQDDDKDAADDK
jgi:Tfp pilus assembly protein PilF